MQTATTKDFWTRIRREDAAADAHGEGRSCGHEDCDMEPCQFPIVRRDAIRADNRGGLVAEASTLGLAPGAWPLVIRVPDRFGALLDFDRLSIDRDDDGDVMMVEYARHDRNRRFVIAVLND
jgi:hypothetical protein